MQQQVKLACLLYYIVSQESVPANHASAIQDSLLHSLSQLHLSLLQDATNNRLMFMWTGSSRHLLLERSLCHLSRIILAPVTSQAHLDGLLLLLLLADLLLHSTSSSSSHGYIGGEHWLVRFHQHTRSLLHSGTASSGAGTRNSEHPIAMTAPPLASLRLNSTGSFSSSHYSFFSQRQHSFLLQQDRKRTTIISPSTANVSAGANSAGVGNVVASTGASSSLVDNVIHEHIENLADQTQPADHTATATSDVNTTSTSSRERMTTRETLRAILNILHFILAYPDTFPNNTSAASSGGDPGLEEMRDYFLKAQQRYPPAPTMTSPSSVRPDSTMDAWMRAKARNVLDALHVRCMQECHWDLHISTRLLCARYPPSHVETSLATETNAQPTANGTVDDDSTRQNEVELQGK